MPPCAAMSIRAWPRSSTCSRANHFRLPRRSMKVLHETEVLLAFDGGNNVGMLALFHAAQATIKKTAAHGVALVTVTDAWMSGRGAYYVEMIAKPPRCDPHCVQLAAGGPRPAAYGRCSAPTRLRLRFLRRAGRSAPGDAADRAHQDNATAARRRRH